MGFFGIPQLLIFLITAFLGYSFGGIFSGLGPAISDDLGCGLAAILAYVIWRIINGFIEGSGGFGELRLGSTMENLFAMGVGGFLGCLLGGFLTGISTMMGPIGGGIGAVLAFSMYIV
jgi:hypothetical protein